MGRESEISRKTAETAVNVSINLDGAGKAEINTGVGFLNHMLSLFAKHGFFDLKVNAVGDLEVDAHHTVEDIGIVLGQALKEAAGDKKSIKRYGVSYLPMDEALSMVVIDFSGRPYLVFDANFSEDMVGSMSSQLVEEFFRAVAFNAGLTLHIKLFYGKNDHHIIESMFKAFGRALDEALSTDDRIVGVMSTKGIL